MTDSTPKQAEAGGGFDLFAWLNAASMADDLTHREFRVLMCMRRYADTNNGGGVRPSMARIAWESGVHVANLRRSTGVVAALARKGWLVQTRPPRQHEPAHYRLSYGSFRGPYVSPSAEPAPALGEAGTAAMEGVVPAATTHSEMAPEGVVATPLDDGDPIQSESPRHSRVSRHDSPNYSRTIQTTRTRSPKPSHASAHTHAHAPAREADTPTLDIIEAEIIHEPAPTPTQAATHADQTITDADELSRHLAHNLRAKGAVAASTRKWTAAMAGLIAAGAEPRIVHHVIDFATRDPFWSGIIDSAPRFAAKYDQLAVAAHKTATNARNGHDEPLTYERRCRDAQEQRWAVMFGPPPPISPDSIFAIKEIQE